MGQYEYGSPKLPMTLEAVALHQLEIWMPNCTVLPNSAWTGPPAKPQARAPYQWPGVVWIDIQGGGSGSGQVDLEVSTDGGSRTAQTTYPVSSMINHRISALKAAEFNRGQPGSDVEPGDDAVLVAMHVAGREIARWTWQTFWWSPTPDDPQDTELPGDCWPQAGAARGRREELRHGDRLRHDDAEPAEYRGPEFRRGHLY